MAFTITSSDALIVQPNVGVPILTFYDPRRLLRFCTRFLRFHGKGHIINPRGSKSLLINSNEMDNDLENSARSCSFSIGIADNDKNIVDFHPAERRVAN